MQPNQAIFDIPEAIAVARRAICASQAALATGGSAATAAAAAAAGGGGFVIGAADCAATAAGMAGLGRVQVLAYYGGMAAYYW